MLKNVVLPAPLGPIRLTIERSGMSKSTSLTAMRPPKTLVIPRASSMLLPFSSGTGSFHGFLFSLTLVQLFRALEVGDYALRSQEHHQDEEEAEQEEVVLRDFHAAEPRAPHRVADGVHPHIYLRQKVEVGPAGLSRPGSRRRCSPCRP